MRKNIFLFLVLTFFSFNAFSFELTGKDFFISLRSNEVNLRTGPGSEYPIRFIYQLKDMPLKVLGEYENWYQVVDKDNEIGWLNKNLTSKKRSLIVIKGTQIMYKKDSVDSNPIFRLEENVVVNYKKCGSTWCKVEVNDKIGWIQTDNLWGFN